MENLKTALLILITLILAGCSENHLINSREYRDTVEKTFAERRDLAKFRETELFSVFDKKLSPEQSEALKFLFAFMPLSDLADYNGDFFLANADIALLTRKESGWGKNIPDDIFLHYVLPLRVNNENLDSFRIKYYDEIISRIGTLSLKEAALEINHWCHEKVTYQPSDIRTSSPMATVLSARGRCGEESTFTVAALRTAGIPARQVYTPRWAHSDDNHAWVEIWDNGEWFYMGACEPEPVLDRGWFTEPARRAMLVHTRSFGAPYGDENTINTFSKYSEVNNLAKYAVTKKLIVSVKGKDGNPVKDAGVEFKLYNYAEFYPLTTILTDENGLCYFETGLGDLLVWASKDGDFDFSKISVDECDTVYLKLGRKVRNGELIDVDLNVPIVRAPYKGISDELKIENEKRLSSENNIRQNYIDSWIQPEDVKAYALERNIDSSRLLSVFSRSMGNYKEIVSFISLVPDSLMEKAFILFETLTDKDLRDIRAVVLGDHLFYCNMPVKMLKQESAKFLVQNTFNPRISNEMIGPWRSYFRSALPDQIVKNAPEDPTLIIKYIEENIKLKEDENYYKTPLTPIGVNELGVTDSWSRAICFVAMCRSLGIPSRIEEGRLIPQFFKQGNWNDVYFSDQVPPSDKKGYIKFSSSDSRPIPEYYTHFTLARFEGGKYITLDYEYNKKASDFTDYISLPEGDYMLVTGNRISDSKILSSLTFFELKANEHKEIIVTLRKDQSEKKIIGTFDLDKVRMLFKNDRELEENIQRNGLVVLWTDPDKEPTKHIFNDLPLLRTELDAWGGYFVFLSQKSSSGEGLDASIKKGLPANSYFSEDINLELLNATFSDKNLPEEKLPLIIVVDNKGNIVYTSVGYRIGIGEQILKHVR